MSNKKAQYKQFCEGAKELPLFLQAWWLDLVCANGSWEVALAFDQGGQITGVLPYYLTKSYGLSIIQLPKLTPYIGVWLRYPDNPQKRTSKYAFEKKVMTELIGQLPKVSFSAHHHPIAVDNGLPFYWQGYESSNWYTYRFASGTPLEEIKMGMKASVRNKIDRAEQNLLLTESFSATAFYELNKLSFDRQELKMPYSLDFFQKLDKALSEKGQRKILIVRDQEGIAHAGIYLVWDQKTLYNLALGGDATLRKSGAIQLLLWKGIQLAMKKGLTFDFEGSMIENIEGVFRDFGGERVPYLRTTRYGSRWWKILSLIIRGK